MPHFGQLHFTILGTGSDHGLELDGGEGTANATFTLSHGTLKGKAQMSLLTVNMPISETRFNAISIASISSISAQIQT